MKFFTAFAFILVLSYASAELSKEGLLERVGKLEQTITETLKKVVGHVTEVVDEAEILVLKAQTTLLKQLAETLSGLPILGDLLLPGIEKTLEGIEAVVDAQVKKIEALLLGATPTMRPTSPKMLPSTIKMTATTR